MGRILVVDDEPHILKLVSFSLERKGHEVFQATDGVAGLKVAAEEKPDLILMDVMMPVMTGYDALDRLKADPKTCDIPVVMLSAKSQHYEQEEGLRRGALQYICKPFTPRDLAETVNSILVGEE
ncbi:MAG: response regulator [Anaerosomatales bacterium]|nr:response regulator [Anaerosomatales bacterium]MDT8435036.1 response regulator [Anaerosomatales bacterium]